MIVFTTLIRQAIFKKPILNLIKKMTTLADIILKHSIRQVRKNSNGEGLMFFDESEGRVYKVIDMGTPKFNDPTSRKVYVQYFDNQGNPAEVKHLPYNRHNGNSLTHSKTLLGASLPVTERLALLLKYGLGDCLHHPAHAREISSLNSYDFNLARTGQ